MSNAGQAVLTIAGAVIGWFVGGPTGAMYGAQLGLLAGTIISPTQLPGVYGPRIEDLATTSAQLGAPVPIIYGTMAVPGTVMFLSCVTEVTQTEEVGGKGAPEQTVTTYSYYQTIALGLCEGPINGILRVWENGELKYDMREQQDGEALQDYADRIEMSSEYGARFVLYLGDETQEPDPTIEMTMGVNEVPAFRGLAYILYPLRQLTDDQARRHPQFRFEVYIGQGTQEILPPTYIAGPLDNHQAPYIVPDWPRNRYYTVDLTGTEGLRRFDVLTNTEQQQITFDDLLPPYLTWQHMGVGPDGWLYFWVFADGNTLRLTSVDPFFFQAQQSITFGGASNVPQRVCFVRWFGSLETIDFCFMQSLFGYFNLRQVYPSLSLQVLTVNYPDQEGLVTDAYRSGTTSYAYGLAWGAALSGTGPEIHIYELVISQEFDLFGIPYADPSITLIATIALASLDPGCTRLSSVSGLLFDETDRCLIFGARGHGPGAGLPIFDCFFKYNPNTGVIVWRSADLNTEIYDDYSQESRLRGGTFGATQSFGDVALIDTRTGAHTEFDFSGDLPNGFTGQQVYDSAHGTLISYVINAGPWVIFLDRRVPGAANVASIVADVCERCGLDAADIDVTDLTDRTVNGYAITRPAPGRGIIEPLRQVAYFDMVESDGQLKYPTRGQSITLALTDDDLGAHHAEDDRPPLVTTQKAQDVELPKRIRVQYIAESRDYDTGDAPSPTRITSSAVNEVDIQVPVSISDDHARQAAEILWADAWGSRWTHEIAVDVAYLGLDPTDVITIPVDGRIHRVRIVSIDDAAGFLRRITLMRDDDGRYTSTAVADTPQRPPVHVIAYSTTSLILLDLPTLRDEDNNAGIYAVAFPTDSGRTWTGAVIHRSVDAGVSYSQVGSVVTAGIVGRIVDAVPSGLSTTWDYENTIEVEMLSGTLESRTESAVINGANAAAIGAHGRWEIVQFQNATQISTTRWQLTGLLRGRRATEHNVGTSLAGDYFVMVSAGGVIRLPLQIAEIGLSRVYRPVTFGTSAAEASNVAFTGTGEALRPFSPVHIHGSRVGGDLIIEWTRRGRLGQELRSGTDIPLSEESEEYEVDILVPGASPETAIRTIETTTTTATYTAADQTTDGFVGGDPITVRVYQISASVGRGTPGEATL
jgi:hypothetical protein